MTNTISYKTKTSPLMQQILFELKFALSHISKEELLKILIESSKVASIATYNSKIRAVKNLIKFSSSTIKRYLKYGFKSSLINDTRGFYNYVIELPSKSKKIYSDFLSYPKDEQVEIVAVTLLSLIIFYLSTGGADFEGGLPDSDIAISGIGKHRNYFSHTILIGLGIEIIGRFGIQILKHIKNKLPNPHHKSWDKVYSFLNNNQELTIAAMWFGIGCHFLKDSGIITGGVKPYSGIPFSLPIEAHQGLFAANGIASTIFSTNIK